MAASQFHLLKTRRFLPLFITQFLGAFNDNEFWHVDSILGCRWHFREEVFQVLRHFLESLKFRAFYFVTTLE